MIVLGEIRRISIKVTVALVVCAIAAILILLYFSFPDYRDQLKFTAAVIAGSSALYSAYYIAAGIKTNIKRDSISKGLDLIKRVDEINLTQIRRFVEQEYDKTKPDEFNRKIRENDELFHSIRKLLGNLEDIAIAIQLGVADEETVKRSLGTIVEIASTRFEHFIKAERLQYGDTEIYCEFERLSVAWRHKKMLAK